MSDIFTLLEFIYISKNILNSFTDKHIKLYEQGNINTGTNSGGKTRKQFLITKLIIS